MLSQCGEGWETSCWVLGDEGAESALLLALVDVVPEAMLLVVGSGCCWGGNWGLSNHVSDTWTWLGTCHPYREIEISMGCLGGVIGVSFILFIYLLSIY